MADPGLEQVNENISLMMLHAQSQMQPEQASAFAGAVSQIQMKYEDAVKTLADKNASADKKKYAKDVTDAINKNLPNMTKAVLSAASAFKSGDYINGSAAIMDICASGAQMLGSLSAAAGPYGAVFGAIFTIVGQLLTYFGPKQPSLKDQIIEAIRGMDADKRLQHTKADGDAVEEYTTTIYRLKSLLPKHLNLPLKKESDLSDFRTYLKDDLISIRAAFDKVSALYKKWETAEWLKDEKTQDLEKWPEILGVFCRTYSDSLVANMALASMANKQLLDQRLEDTSSSNPIYEQHRHDFDKINDLLIDLRAIVLALPEVWDDGNDMMRQFLQKVRPVAQDRGLFVILGNDQNLYAATGRKGIQSDTWKPLPIGYGNRGRRFSITVPKEDAGSLKPEYHVFFCQKWIASDNGDVEHGRIKPSSLEISGQGMITGDQYSDVWALPSPRGGGASFVYAAHNGGADGNVKLFEMDARNQLTDGNWQPATKSGVVNVRAVTHPPATLSDDPDKDGMPPGSLLLGGVNHYNSIVYGALGSSSEIYVDQSNTRCYVPSPWATYSGIDVDPYYLWVFRPQGFACATHASVISCILGKRQTPRWMEYSPTELLGDQSNQGNGNFWLVNGQETKPRPPLVGLTSLSPCQDGTLFANIFTRTVSRYSTGDHWVFAATDSPAMYTAVYSIDLKEGRINVDPWVKTGGHGPQSQKMPIPCWSLFESLNADLQQKLKTQ
ncbi:MAG TPA: hypothetical protein VJ464_02310 [Blastocatellia bacterium]|nr:hypothetical protein [Blastocatellia bacterium]